MEANTAMSTGQYSKQLEIYNASTHHSFQSAPWLQTFSFKYTSNRWLQTLHST